MSKKNDPLNAMWDSLYQFKTQYLSTTNEEVLVWTGWCIETDKATYTMLDSKVKRIEKESG